MISTRNTNTTTLRGCPIGTKASFEMCGARQEMVFDGKVEDVVFNSLLDPEKSFKGLTDLARLLKDDSGHLAAGKERLDKGVPAVSIDVGKTSPWQMRRSNASPGVVELWNPNSGMVKPEQTIILSGNYVTLLTAPTFAGPGESIVQQVVGQYNPVSGTITCLGEEIQRTTTRSNS